MKFDDLSNESFNALYLLIRILISLGVKESMRTYKNNLDLSIEIALLINYLTCAWHWIINR